MTRNIYNSRVAVSHELKLDERAQKLVTVSSVVVQQLNLTLLIKLNALVGVCFNFTVACLLGCSFTNNFQCTECIICGLATSRAALVTMTCVNLSVVCSAIQSCPLVYVLARSIYYRRGLEKAQIQLCRLSLLQLVRLCSLRTQAQATSSVYPWYHSLLALLRALIAPLWLPLRHLHHGTSHP